MGSGRDGVDLEISRELGRELGNGFGDEFLDLIKDLRREMCGIGRRIFARRLVSGKSGNISVRVPEHDCWPGGFLIKATDRSFDDMNENEFLLVNDQGIVLAGRGEPSGEMGFHRGIYLARPEVQAVVHGHSACVTAYVMEAGDLPVVTEEARHSLQRIGYIDYVTPRTPELAALVTDVFRGDLRAAVLRNHGFVTVARSLREAYYLADALEENAKVACVRRMLR
ncbi:MAG: class II aldolase/adducin family protein [Peptococcaceae bacterium]|nr:class II aldolase/adducin family protein [Peptococcaceae bacterium]